MKTNYSYSISKMKHSSKKQEIINSLINKQWKICVYEYSTYCYRLSVYIYTNYYQDINIIDYQIGKTTQKSRSVCESTTVPYLHINYFPLNMMFYDIMKIDYKKKIIYMKYTSCIEDLKTAECRHRVEAEEYILYSMKFCNLQVTDKEICKEIIKLIKGA